MSSDWPLVSVAEIASSENGSLSVGPFGSRMKAELYTSSGVRVIRGNNLNGGREPEGDYVFVSEQTANSLASCCLKPGDLVFPHRGNIGQVGITPADGHRYMLSSSLMKLSLDRTKAFPLYIMYFFKSTVGRFALLANASQVGTPGIATPLKSLREIKFPLPPLKTQERIASIMSLLDDRIFLLDETNTTLEAIAQALFKSWFVDFDPVRANQLGQTPEGMDEASAKLFPDSFEESKANIVPKGWEIKSLGDISVVGIGKTPPRKEPEWFSENPIDVKWVSIRDMGASGCFIANTNECLTMNAVERFNVRLVPNHTVLMSFKLTVGRIAISDGEMTTNEAIAHFKLSENSRLPTEYIYLYLKQFNFDSLSSTSSIADAVNSKTVKNIPIIVPPIEIVTAFQDKVAIIFQKIKLTGQKAQTLKTLRDAMLPRLISGQLHLPEAEISSESEKTL